MTRVEKRDALMPVLLEAVYIGIAAYVFAYECLVMYEVFKSSSLLLIVGECFLFAMILLFLVGHVMKPIRSKITKRYWLTILICFFVSLLCAFVSRSIHGSLIQPVDLPSPLLMELIFVIGIGVMLLVSARLFFITNAD